MTTPNFENLDLACAKAGKEITAKKPKDKLEKIEKIVTDALGVLEEQGVYALFLFLWAHTKEQLSKEISEKLFDFMKQTPRHEFLIQKEDKDILIALHELNKDFDNLLLARDLLRQTLIYARYHARMREERKVVT